ncbi:MAG: Ldh family oxidoreductase [Promethearchaeota archaeon]
MSDDKEIFIPLDKLWEFEKDCFMGMGVPEEDAKICADVLLEADKRGIDSHGVGRLFMYYARVRRGQQKPVTKIDVIRDMGAIARLNGNNGMGQPVSHKAMSMAIEKAKKYGIGMAVVEGSNHYGIAGYYALMASQQGCIGISGTNARPSIAPTWGTEAMIGTNPLTIALPTDWDFDWYADHATSITQRGKIELYARLNKELVKGWVINASGENPVDAKQVLKDMLDNKAALMPLGGPGEEMGGYKGYNYAMFVEFLSAGLGLTNYLRDCLGFDVVDGKKVFKPYNLGHFFIAINVEAFIELDVFKKRVGDMLRRIANSRKQPGADHIYVAGEKEWVIMNKRKETGVPIPSATQLQMQQMVHEMNLDSSKYGIEWSVKYDPNAVDSQGW